MKTSAIILSIAFTCRGFAQEGIPLLSIDGGLKAGAMNCLTDLGGSNRHARSFISDLQLASTRAAAGLYGQLSYRQRIGLELGFISGTISAADHRIRGSDDGLSGRYGRNLSFSSKIHEVSMVTDVRVFNKWWYGDEGIHRFAIGIFAGFAAFYSDPRAELLGTWYKLREFRLEGQGFAEYPGRKVYKSFQAAIPFGLTLSRTLTNGFSFGAEFCYRYLFTDYLDDVSNNYIDPSLFLKYLDGDKALIARQLQFRTTELMATSLPLNQQRGNPAKKDAWFSVGLRAGVRL